MNTATRIVSFLLLIPLLSFCRSEPEPFVIGTILSMTGAGGTVGQDIRRGMEFAIEEINKNGGLDGRLLELVIVDSASAPEIGEAAFLHLEKTKRPLFYVTTLSSISLKLKPLAEKNQVVLAGIGVAAKEFTTECQWCYRFWVTPENDMRAFNSHCDRFYLKKIGVLFLDDQFGASFLEVIKRESAARGVEVVSKRFQCNEENITRQISKMIDCDVIYTISYPSQLESLWTQIRAAGFEGYLMTNNTISTYKTRALPVAEGGLGSAPMIYNSNYTLAAQINARFQNMFGEDMPELSGSGYQLIKIMAGLLSGENVNRNNVRQLLEGGFIYQGVLGAIELKAGDHDITHEHLPVMITDGRLEFLDAY